jgi:hypothetical protein
VLGKRWVDRRTGRQDGKVPPCSTQSLSALVKRSVTRSS